MRNKDLPQKVFGGQCVKSETTMAAEQRLLDDILQHYAPDYWTSTSRYEFEGSRYIRRTVSNGEAYDMAVRDLRGHYSILQVDVIENPYQYGRFLIRKEHLRKQGRHVVERQMYHPVLEEDVDQALEYNCDTRYYNAHSNYMQCSNKRTRFYAMPQHCESFFNNGFRKVFIVLSVLADNEHSDSVVTDYDTHYYPMFVVITT
ncbi:uncharacterized protein LOC126471403 [Schistocerca serialis cubense]|uniref:uncharacterized protein LOC126471403 n=1 Tax=Schistocerca serialis cubense TaxID=2023355 RepID=UPI00214E2C38|nr:uncharacterized protein LOC126471403 [Schistocerca serialis cubense]